MLRTSSSLILLTLLVFAPPLMAAEEKSAVTTIQDFYKRYISYDHSKQPMSDRPRLALSKAFLAEVKSTDALCKNYGEGPCGWGADGDEYLDTQEIDPGITYSNSGITVREVSPGTIQVKLNVYPSVKDAGKYYEKTITFRMIRENDSFVVDDVAYTDGVSTRKVLSDERKELFEHSKSHAH